MAETDWLMALADEIGSRIEAGNLPPQDSSGRYLLDHAAAEVAHAATEGMKS